MLLIKIGGGNDLNWQYIAQDLAQLNRPFILLHGANERMAEITDQMGQEVRMIKSPSGYTSRYSDQATMDIFLQAYAGVTNKRWVELLQQNGINAVGLSGIDGGLFRGTKKDKIIGYVQEENKQDNHAKGRTSHAKGRTSHARERAGKPRVIRDSYTGNVEEVNIKLLNCLLDNDFVPILTAPALSYDNEIMNIDNDRAAAVLIRDLGITECVMLFAAPGLLKNHKDESTKIDQLTTAEFEQALEFANGRMKKKVLGAKEAFENGLKKMYWGDGRIENPITSALAGNGTVITK